MYKFFLNQEDVIEENHIILNHADSVRHLEKSLRIKSGELITLSTGALSYIGKVTEVTPQMIKLEIVDRHEAQNESPLKIDLYQCLPKGQKLELIIQKNVELGVRDFYLVASKRCIVEYKGKDIQKKLDRLDKIALEAAKQSKRDYISTVKAVLPIEKLGTALSEYDLVLILYESEENLFINDVLKAIGPNELKTIAVIVGPEGGFEPSEIEFLKANGAQIVTLGKRILRTETAGFTCVTCLQYAVGDLSSRTK
ncbi:RsmE family RNA methyltransferase [Fusibacter ferrireducens]|uniref:Ribosomal RNA small subunit methyltransferase E n=1 Tax=Fusibacter ferrireducens TaxID=2785058 RepID=A0ABR9ZWT1_9FIRM|nr:RsmE family RNA methyltransferase [Fusibacter ferrireducens]MBF4694913.1 16S rRNA (uracil(1498)-N(3))-methyltransferase [Fusibacter ferrireducens]